MNDSLDPLAIATLRALAMDMPRAANSGHSGTAMALAPLGWWLYTRILRHNPLDPGWPNRDRLILSNGHACVLLYGLLHLCGYDLSLQDLKEFRRPGSRTPGHPESWVTPGIDFSTGPLGQGLAAAVGMAWAERMLRQRFGPQLVDHLTYAICSDGDLMEGVSAEASSLAGHQKLGKLIVFYDDNQVTIDGPASLSWSENVERRYEAYGWQVLSVRDGEDLPALEQALQQARADERPSLIRVRTIIGFPAPTMQGRCEAHSPPFSAAEIRACKERMGLDPDLVLAIPEELAEVATRLHQRGQAAQQEWSRHLTPEWQQWHQRNLPAPWKAPEFSQPVATRVASGKILQSLVEVMPQLRGGSADLAGSTNTAVAGGLPFGVREQAMAALCNGLAQHGGIIPFCSTYFAFSDQMKPALRLAALARIPIICLWTHDSLALGEDGPTHQPVEQLAGLRAMPNFLVIRPADAHETVQAWKVAIGHTGGPVGLILSRQTLPLLKSACPPVQRGAYVVQDAPPGAPTLLATGSEVHLCLDASRLLEFPVRVVSMPCWELFEQQGADYQQSVLGRGPRLAVEAAASLGWHRWADEVLALDRFGASGPGQELMALYGFTPEAVAARLKGLCQLKA